MVKNNRLKESGCIMPIGRSGTRLLSSGLLVALTVLVAAHSATPAWAWGRLGHRVISRLAEKNLNPKAKAAIAALLDESESLADASTWADENRRRLPKTAPWHYVDVPLDEPRYDSKWSADDPKKGCVVDKINEFRAVLKDPAKSRKTSGSPCGSSFTASRISCRCTSATTTIAVETTRKFGSSGCAQRTDNGWGTVPDPDHWET